MSAENIAEKVVLLLQPQRLPNRKPVVQLLKLTKAGKQIQMEEIAINPQNVNQLLKHIDPLARKQLLRLSEGSITSEQFSIQKKLAQLSLDDEAHDAQAQQAMTRYYHQCFSFLKSYDKKLSWYHRLAVAESNRMQTVPCVFHPLSAQLQFVVHKQDHGFTLAAMIKTGDETVPIDRYRRFSFLLLHDNQYWHLNAAATDALDWFAEQPSATTILSADDCINMLVEPLRKKGQQVDTDAMTEQQMIEVLPTKRLLLSELNNSFLMLTPQFIYDGMVIEGAFEPSTVIRRHSEAIAIKRSETDETAFDHYLKALHPNFSRQINGYYYLSFADAQKKQWFSKVYHQLLIDNVEITGMDMLKHFRYSPHQPVTTMKVTGVADDSIQLDFQLQYGKEKVPLRELQQMLRNGQKVVLLKDGSMGVLGEAWLTQYGTAIKHARISDKQIWVPRWLALSISDDGELQAVQKTLPADWLSRWHQWRNSEEQLFALPSLVNTTLRPYQHKGYEWMNLLSEAGGSFCLADDMGLGKTLQSICFITRRLQENPSGKHLVVCPASLIYNWQQEFEKFALPVTVGIYHGASRNSKMLEDNSISVIITSYGTLRQDIHLVSVPAYDTMVLDESHHIKNPSTQINKAIKEVNSLTRLALSGTPVMNSLLDLYAQIDFLLPGLLGSREFFKKEYSIPIEQEGDEEKAAILRRIINPFILRRTKEQVAQDLPPKTEMVMWCHMGDEQRYAYESIKENIRNSVLLEIADKGLQQGKMSVLAGLTKLRQACNSAELVKNEDLFCHDSIKTEMLIEEILQIIPSHKALVFSQYTSMLDLLERDMKQKHIQLQRLDGSTDVKKRQELANNFQQEDDAKVFLLSLKAGNAGLNLTAADYVFLFDPWWNVAVENQAIDRTHRIGQNKQVFAYRMICKGTIEEKILHMQQRKQKLSNDLISTEEGFVSSLTEEDIRFLLA